MKIPRIVNAMGHIDDDLISGAVESKKKKKNPWIKWGSFAACFALLVITGAAVLPSLLGDRTAQGKYQYQLSGMEMDVEWPWEYKTNGEKYPVIQFGGKEFHIKSLRTVDRSYLGEELGTCQAEGVDSYTQKSYTETFEVYRINHVSEEKMIAIGNETGYYVYDVDEKAKPETFGQVLDLYGLSQNLKFSHFTKYEGYKSKGYFTLDDDAYIWQILSGCRDAKLYSETDSFDRRDRNYLSFTATSDPLGVFKRVVYISEDGYFSTNIFDYSYTYFIGREKAGEIIDYAQSNCTETEFVPYALSVAGTLTEIGDGYVLIDDTPMCFDPKDGMVYRVFTDDIRMKRCMECFDIQVGDTVGAQYEEPVSGNHEIHHAYSIYKGTLVDGDLAVPE